MPKDATGPDKPGLDKTGPARTRQYRPGLVDLGWNFKKRKLKIQHFAYFSQLRNSQWKTPGFKSVKLRHPRATWTIEKLERESTPI